MKMRRSSWIIPVGPKCHHICPYKKEAMRENIKMQEGEGSAKSEAEIRGTRPQTQKCWGSHQKLKEARN